MNVIELAKEKGSVSRKEIEKLLGVSQSICGRLLKQMLMDGQIVQQGKGKIHAMYFRIKVNNQFISL